MKECIAVLISALLSGIVATIILLYWQCRNEKRQCKQYFCDINGITFFVAKREYCSMYEYD